MAALLQQQTYCYTSVHPSIHPFSNSSQPFLTSTSVGKPNWKVYLKKNKSKTTLYNLDLYSRSEERRSVHSLTLSFKSKVIRVCGTVS